MAMQFSDGSYTPLSASRSCIALSSCAMQSTSVKIGGLWKRSQGVSRFTKSNYKHRVFILTDQALSYYGGTVDRVGQIKGRVPLESVRAVEFVDMSAFSLAHTMQVVYISKKSGFTTLYIIATTKEECSDWVATLRQACYFNRDMLMHYHPGAFMKNKWTCCRQRGRTTLGCQPTYHLLTRSSSRYAQMRRKDTLTGSTNDQRRANTVRSTRSYRSTNVTSATASTDIEDASSEVRSPGRGLSNSYMELSSHPPHSESIFTLSSPPAASSGSRRSSKNSTEHSVGVGTMALTRISLSEDTAEGVEEEEEFEEEGEEGGASHRQSRSLSQSSTPKHFKSDRVRAGSRSQVAPAWPTGSSPLIGRSRSDRGYRYQNEHQTLPRSFKSRPPPTGLNNSWNHSVRSEERGDPVGGEEAHPNPPPRLKRGQYSPTVSSLVEATHMSLPCSQTVPNTPNIPAKLKHSNTFAADPRVKNLQAKSFGFSQSLGTLSKPLIEPKLSVSNPNVIHV